METAIELSLQGNASDRGYRGYSSPLTYYLAHSELHSLGRTGLGRKRREGGDPGLLRSFYRWEQTDLAIPEKITGYRGYSNPLAYYTGHPELHNLSRIELGKPENDPGLLRALYRWEQIEVIPVKEGYQKGHAGRHLPPGAREEIMRARGRFSSFRSAEKHLPACRKTIAKIWARMDLEK